MSKGNVEINQNALWLLKEAAVKSLDSIKKEKPGIEDTDGYIRILSAIREAETALEGLDD